MTREQRALQIWSVLIGCAHRRETIRYDVLAKLIGFDGPPHWLSESLGRVMRFCEKRGLPPLTVLVVNKSGKPSDGLITSQDFDQDRENVYDVPWLRETPLATQDLTQPWREEPDSTQN
jgi:hypothetical protein